jgi:creatinine amidohydrolase
VNGVVQSAVPLLGSLPVWFLPTQTVGFSPEHLGFAGTLSLQASTLMAMWTDIGDSVAACGIRKLVLFNAHGGQAGLMDAVGRDLRQRHDMQVWSVNWYDLPGDEQTEGLFDAHEKRFGIHAGAVETSMMLALAPQQVDMALAQAFASTSETRAQRFEILGNGRSAKLSWAMQDYNPAGATGNAASATADKGRALLDNAGRRLAQLLTEIDQVTPLPKSGQARL